MKVRPTLAVIFTCIAIIALNYDGVHRQFLPGYLSAEFLARVQVEKIEELVPGPNLNQEFGWPFCFAEVPCGARSWSVVSVVSGLANLSLIALLADLSIGLLLACSTYAATWHLLDSRVGKNGIRLTELIALTTVVALCISGPGTLYPKQLSIQLPGTIVIASALGICFLSVFKLASKKR